MLFNKMLQPLLCVINTGQYYFCICTDNEYNLLLSNRFINTSSKLQKYYHIILQSTLYLTGNPSFKILMGTGISRKVVVRQNLTKSLSNSSSRNPDCDHQAIISSLGEHLTPFLPCYGLLQFLAAAYLSPICALLASLHCASATYP